MEKITFLTNQRWIVVYGNPVDGFEYCGPFTSTEEANDWADENVHQSLDWWVAKLGQL